MAHHGIAENNLNLLTFIVICDRFFPQTFGGRFNMKRSSLLRIFIVIIAAIILTVSLVTFLHADRLDDCHTFCASEYPTNFRLYEACMKGCLHVPNQ